VAQLADAVSATVWGGTGPNTALAFGGLTYQAAGPLSTQAITTDGSTAWAETATEYTDPATFTVLVWLKTTASGGILGFSNAQDPPSVPTDHDRLLWVDPTGRLVWGIYGSTTEEITSPLAVNTGSWVFAAASVGPAGTALYVNGTGVASNATYTTPANYMGWWTIAWASLSGWPDLSTSDYFNGSLAQLAIVPSQLSAAQITGLYADNTLSTYSSAVSALAPANYWPFNDSGSVPYLGAVPGDQTMADSSGHADTGTAVGNVALRASGPTTIGTSYAISLDGSSGYMGSTTAYSDPEGFSVVAWFKTSTTSGGTIVGFDSSQNNVTSIPNYSDRLLWMDDTGHLVWGIYDNSVTDELTTGAAYNTGAWVMAVAEVGSSGAELYVNGSEVAHNTTYTAAQAYTGYWHLGWGYEVGWTDAPASGYLNGSLSEAAVIPSQLSAAKITTLYGETSTANYATYMASLDTATTASYWPLQDLATSICGTSEVTVQQTVGATNTCLYPAAAGSCPAPSSTYLVTGLGTRPVTPPTSSTAVTITIAMELSATSSAAIAGLHVLPDIAFATAGPSAWSAHISYPAAGAEL
jgi:hypothetical protein